MNNKNKIIMLLGVLSLMLLVSCVDDTTGTSDNKDIKPTFIFPEISAGTINSLTITVSETVALNTTLYADLSALTFAKISLGYEDPINSNNNNAVLGVRIELKTENDTDTTTLIKKIKITLNTPRIVKAGDFFKFYIINSVFRNSANNLNDDIIDKKVTVKP